MVERKEGFQGKEAKVKNLNEALATIYPPLSELQIRYISRSLDNLVDYVVSKGALPPGFRGVNDKPDGRFTGATHVSHRDWGWLGKHKFTTLIKFEETNAEDPITVIAVVRSKTTSSLRDEQNGRKGLRSQSFRRAKGVKVRGEVPKFRK